MNESIKSNIFSVYISSNIPVVLTFLFWIFISNYSGPEVIGTISVLYSISFIISQTSQFGIPISMKTFIGKNWQEKTTKSIKSVFFSSVFILIITTSIVLIIFLNPYLGIMDMLGVEVDFSSIIIAIVVGINIQSLSNGVLTSVLKSKKLIYPTIISALSKFPVLFIFISIFDNSEFFIVLSYASSSIVIGLLLGIIVLQTIHQIDGKNVLNIKFNSKLLLKGGISHWIPTMIGTIGTYSGILVIFSTKGAQETGLFYIPFTVYSVLLLVSSAITNISHPVLSGIKTIDEQKGFLKKTLKMNLLLVMPLASIMLFYSQDIFSIFGAEYNFSSEVMNYLIISIPFTVVGYGTYFLFFAKMHYRKILLLGLISNISKVALYFILVPTLGGLGTAIAIMIGELLLVITAIILLEKIQIRLPYKQFLIIIFIPMIIGFIVQLIPIGFIGTIIILPVTFFFYIKFQIMTKEEVCNTSSLILGKEKGTLLANKIEKLFKIK